MSSWQGHIDWNTTADVCTVCSGTEMSGEALVCDLCNSAETHFHCLRPQIISAPSGNWYCEGCLKVTGFFHCLSTGDSLKRLLMYGLGRLKASHLDTCHLRHQPSSRMRPPSKMPRPGRVNGVARPAPPSLRPRPPPRGRLHLDMSRQLTRAPRVRGGQLAIVYKVFHPRA